MNSHIIGLDLNVDLNLLIHAMTSFELTANAWYFEHK